MAGTAAETPQQALVFWTMFYKVGITLNHLRSGIKLFGLSDIINAFCGTYVTLLSNKILNYGIFIYLSMSVGTASPP